MAKATPANAQETPAISAEQPGNLALWESVQKTDPNYTKSFTRGGGFKGTSTNATYLAKRATETFGPMGIGWGLNVISEKIVDGHPFVDNGVVIGHAKVHVVHAKLWYVRGDIKGEIEQFGQTEFTGRRNDGKYFTDEEAPKKSLTDAMTKALSLLGFAADIHLGLYDDNKYINDVRAEFGQGKDPELREPEPRQQPERQQTTQQPRREGPPKMSVDQHVSAMQSAQDYETLKRAFGLAWKQYENPNDPKVQTMAQVKFKEIYDKERERVIPPTDTAQTALPATGDDNFEESLQ